MAQIKFEEGQTYIIETAVGIARFTVVKRTAKTIVLQDGRRYMLKEMGGEEYIDLSLFSATVSLCASHKA